MTFTRRIAIALIVVAGMFLLFMGKPSSLNHTPTHPNTPPSSTTASAHSDEEVKRNQLEKFNYMQSPDRLSQFEDSGYDVAKVKLARDIMAGKYGKTSVDTDDSMFSVEVGDHDNAKKVYAWFYADIKNGSPDFSSIWNIGIKAPGHNYVEITDTVHDWPTQVNGESVDLKYRVAVGPNSLSPTHDTCLWPDLGKEKKFCYGDGNEGATKTYVDMVSADQNALRTMDETMTDLYGPNWRKG